jgi:hypothetical protein
MKNILLTLIVTFTITALSFGQPSPGNNSDGSDPGGGALSGNSGGGAPIGSGIALMLTLGGIYGLAKTARYSQMHKE